MDMWLLVLNWLGKGDGAFVCPRWPSKSHHCPNNVIKLHSSWKKTEEVSMWSMSQRQARLAREREEKRKRKGVRRKRLEWYGERQRGERGRERGKSMCVPRSPRIDLCVLVHVCFPFSAKFTSGLVWVGNSVAFTIKSVTILSLRTGLSSSVCVPWETLLLLYSTCWKALVEVTVLWPAAFPKSSATWKIPSSPAKLPVSTFLYLENAPGSGRLTLSESCL